MKKISIGISVVVLFLSGSFVFAQMDGGMMEGQKSGMSHGQRMEHGEMMGGMMEMSGAMGWEDGWAGGCGDGL